MLDLTRTAELTRRFRPQPAHFATALEARNRPAARLALALWGAVAAGAIAFYAFGGLALEPALVALALLPLLAFAARAGQEALVSGDGVATRGPFGVRYLAWDDVARLEWRKEGGVESYRVVGRRGRALRIDSEQRGFEAAAARILTVARFRGLPIVAR